MTTARSELALSSRERDRVIEVQRHEEAGAAGVPALIAALDDPSWGVRRAVVATLARLGDAAVPALCAELCQDRSSEGKIAACVDALAESTGDADTPLIELLSRTEDPMLACDAAQILGRRRSERALPALSARVQDPSDNVAVAAIEALGRVGGAVATDPLLAALKSGNFFRIFPAIDVLGRTGDPRAVGALIALLDEPLYRQEAARALGRTGDPAALPPLVAMLGRAGDALLRVAAAALVELHDRATAAEEGDGRSSPAGSEWAGALAEVVTASLTELQGRPVIARRLAQCAAAADAGEQAALCRVLAWVGGEPAIAALLDLLEGPPPARQAATAALRELGAAIEPMLATELRESGSARRARILPLVGLGASLAPEVLLCLDDPEAHVRALACEALARIGDPSRVAALFRRLTDPDAYVVQSATGAFQALGGPEAEALALRAARTSTGSVRRASIQILGHLAPQDALEVLLTATLDADERIREAAIQGLPSCAAPAADEQLLALTHHESPRTRAAVMRALGRTARTTESRRNAPPGSAASAAREGRIAALQRALRDPDPWVRYYACQSLGVLEEPAAATAVAGLIEDEAAQVRLAAVEALAHFDTAEAREALLDLARSADPDLQRAAVLGLGTTQRPEVLPALIEASRSADPTTRLAALATLPGFRGTEVDQAITRLTADPDPEVRRLAERAQRR